MTDQEWFEYYDENLPSFKWFILKYFTTGVWLALKEARDDSDRQAMTTIMNHLWFHLPDHRFNIIENPVGWSEFLHLVES